MCLKIIFTYVLTLTSLALGAEIMLRMEIDDSAANTDPSDLVFNIIPKFLTPNFNECGLSVSTTADDNPIELSEQTSTTEGRMSSENDNEETTLPMIINDELQLNVEESTSVEKPEIGNNNIRLNISGNGFPMFDAVDKIRQVDNHEEIGLHFIDPPQTQLVDNTLRVQAIKSSVDDLASKIFPHLHMIQHLLDDHQVAH